MRDLETIDAAITPDYRNPTRFERGKSCGCKQKLNTLPEDY